MKTVQGFSPCMPISHYFLDSRDGQHGTQKRVVSRAERLDDVIRPAHWVWIESVDADLRRVF